jgi:hypothetical protein
MLNDFTKTIADIAVLEITDLVTLGLLVSNASADILASRLTCSTMLLGCLLPNLKEMSINLRLPLTTYKAFDETSPYPEPSLLFAWTTLPLVMEMLSKLSMLRIWLNHDDPISWSVVNERAMLSPLVSLASRQNLNVSIDFPKRHPRWETPERHSTDNHLSLSIAIHRQYRQRFRVVKGGIDNDCVKYEPDFPIMYEFPEWDDVSIEEVEEGERICWETTHWTMSGLSCHSVKGCCCCRRLG